MNPEKIPETIAPPEGAPEKKPAGEPPEGGSTLPPAKKRRSWFAALFRIVFLLLIVLALVPIAAEIALRHVPFETWKPAAERELSQALGMPATLNDAQLSLLSGARIEGITVGGEAPLVRVREMVLDYDLYDLFNGRLTINQVLVDRPELHLAQKGGRWNFQPLLEGREASAPKAAPRTGEPADSPDAGLPPIPLAVSIKDLSIKNLRLHFEREGQDRGYVDGLSLAAHGTLDKQAMDLALAIEMSRPPEKTAKHNMEYTSSEGQGTQVKTLALANLGLTTKDLNRIGLSGRFSLSNNQVKLGDALPGPDLSSDFDIGLALKEQALDINRLHLEIDGTHRIKLSAAVRKFGTRPHLDLTLAEAAFDIEKALKLAKQWLPPTEAGGSLTLTGVHVAGEFPDFKPGVLVADSGRIDLLNFQAHHAPARVRGVNAQVTLKHLKLNEGVPEALNATARVQAAEGQAGEISLTGLSQIVEVSATNPRLTGVKLDFITDVKSITLARPELAGLDLPLHVKGALTGNWAAGDFPSITIDYATGDAIQGTLLASAKKLGHESFHIKKIVRLDLAALQGLIPGPWIEKLPGLRLGGGARLTTEMEGALDQDFKPGRLAATTRVDVEGLDIALTEPALDLRQLTAQVSLPAEYDRSLGARLGTLRLQAGVEGLDALDNWRIGKVHIATEVNAGEKYIALPLAENLKLTHSTVVKLARVHSAEPPLTLGGFGLETVLKAEMTPAQEVRNVKVDGTLSLDQAAALGKISTGALKSTFAAFTADRTLTRTDAAVTLDLAAPSYRDGEWQLVTGPVHFSSRTRHNLKTGDIEIDKVKLGIPSLLDWEASGQARNWGEAFDLKTSTSNLMLASLMPLLPPKLAETLDGLTLGGRARLDLAAKGRRPKGFDRKQPDLPLDVHALIELADGLVEWPAKDIHIKSANISTRLDTEGQAATLSGQAGLLFSTPALQDTWLDPRFEFSYTLDGADKLTVKTERLTVPGIGLTHTLSGRIGGLRTFITGEAPAQTQDFLRRLDIALKTQNQLQVAQALKGPALKLGEGIEARGAIDSHLDLRLKPGDSIELGGQVAFDRFHARLPGDLSIDAVNGSFPFNKKLWIEKHLQPEQEIFRASRRGFFSQLRSFSSHKNILQAGSIQWRGHQASGIKMDLLFEDNQLRAEKFIFDILGGALAGNFFLTQSAEGPQLNFFTEFAGLNFDRLVPAGAAPRQPGAGNDAEIDGSLRLSLQLRRQGSGALSLDQVAAEVAITRIGAETLDRLLLLIDPGESKPAIVDTRAKLKLASPHEILITLDNGNLNVDAWLKNKVMGDIIKAPELRRVPVSGLQQFKDLSDRLQSLTGLRDALGYLAARALAFDADQNLLLR